MKIVINEREFKSLNMDLGFVHEAAMLNVHKLLHFIADTEKNASNSWPEYFYQGRLSPGKVANSAGFKRTIFQSNVAVLKVFNQLEKDLATHGISQPVKPKSEIKNRPSEVSTLTSNEESRLKRENAQLKTRVLELEAMLSVHSETHQLVMDMGLFGNE